MSNSTNNNRSLSKSSDSIDEFDTMRRLAMQNIFGEQKL